MRSLDMSTEQKKQPEARYNLPQQHGILVVHKPKGPTSAACIAKIKRCLGQKKIGHAGTLDPMAQGVLLVLLGQGTKLSGHLMGAGDKIYSGVIRLGVTTDTWDAEGAVLEERPAGHVGEQDVRQALAGLVGRYEQEVPPYSAAKHQGKPLYALARKGLETPVKKKVIEISHGEVVWYDPPDVAFRVRCSSGTYIRSLAHSLGIRLGCGAMLKELSREYSHPFGLDEAFPLESIVNEPEGFAAKVTALEKALPGWPVVSLDKADSAKARNGCFLPCPESLNNLTPGVMALLKDDNGNPLALAEFAVKGEPGWTIIRGLWNQ